VIGTIDVVYGKKEARRLNTVTGSDVAGFKVPCDQKSCSYIELSGNPLVYGKQWISGKSQEVEGGSGLLKIVNGGKEPTGRLPLGPTFKFVMTDVTESEGTAGFTLYTRVCGLGCTPYFIPTPISFTLKEKDLILLGP
jgi:hypothetical protein